MSVCACVGGGGWHGFGIYTEKQTKIKYSITTSTLNHNNDLSV